MSYVRGRRLEAAMRRILTDPGARIIDLAFEYGFDSQEAFTRAFARAFGHPPGRLRSLGPVTSMLRRKKTSPLEPELHERGEVVPELHLAGLAFRVTPANSAEFPAMWRRVEALRGFPGMLDSSLYVLLLNVDRRDGAIEMMITLRAAPDAAVPPQLVKRSLPGGTCTVFRHVVRKGDVYPQIHAAREVILKRYIARFAQPRPVLPALEVYPQGLGVTAGSWIDHYFSHSWSVQS
jgi:AraC family transcriptional regulator